MSKFDKVIESLMRFALMIILLGYFAIGILQVSDQRMVWILVILVAFGVEVIYSSTNTRR